jgi:plastocyanin
MKTLHLSIIVVLLGFIGLAISHDNSGYGLWIRKSPQELLNGSSTIFVGNITSVNVLQLKQEQSYTIQENGTDKNIVQNYTLNLDEYKVDVEEFLKNPQNTVKMTVRQPTIGLPTGLGGLDKFKTGDRVLFYIKNLDGINEYSPESFVIPKSCVGEDVLTQNRLESRGESVTIQNGMKVDYSNFTANQPILFIDNEDVDTLSGKSLDVQVYITKTVGNGAEIVFRKDIHAEAKPCEWTTSAKWEFTPQEGEYGMAVRISGDNTTYSQYYGKFSVKSDVMTPDHMSPLKQFKSGVAANDVICRSDLQLLIQNQENFPICVKLDSVPNLLHRDWSYPTNCKYAHDPFTAGVAGLIIIENDASNPSSGKSYSPRNSTVVIGWNNTVSWLNQDLAPSSITSDWNLFDSGQILPGADWHHEFECAGNYGYHSEPHPWMKGWIRVLPPSR